MSTALRETLRAETREMIDSSDWDGVRVEHVVALYDLMHEKVYGVRPTDISLRADHAAKELVEREFGGSVDRTFDYARWFWTREANNEKRRRKTKRDGRRADWRVFLSSAAVSDYRVDLARRGEGVPAPPREASRASTAATPAEAALTDLGNAQRLVARHGSALRYTPTHGWLVYDGCRWTQSTTGQVERFAKETVRAMLKEAADTPDARDSSELAKHAVKSQSARALAAMISLAKTEAEVATTIDAFDRDPMLLNCQNGTVDLRTGELRPHARGDMLTRIAPAPFDPEARSDLWDRVLLEAMGGDAEMVAFLARFLGYASTGSTAEEKLFLPIGPGGTSKSTVFGAVQRTLGDYAGTANFESFVAKKGDGGIRNDVARLRGMRLVLSVEVEEGRHLAQALLKQMSGGDQVTARFLYSEEFSFIPEFKLCLVANDPPRVSDLDTGMWRRIQRVPFERVVPEDRRDPKVKAELFDVGASGPAILAWLVRGALEWQRVGLAAPAKVDAATEAYREDQNPLRDFLGEECRLGPSRWTTRKALLERYEAWRKESGTRHALTPRTIAERLRKLGVEEAKKGGDRGWKGIGLVDHQAAADDEQMPAIVRDWPTAQEIRRGDRAGAVDEDEKLRAERRRRRRATVSPAQAALGALASAPGGDRGAHESPCFSEPGHMGHQPRGTFSKHLSQGDFTETAAPSAPSAPGGEEDQDASQPF